MYRQSEKKLSNSNISSTSSQYGKRRPTNGWDRFNSLGHPSTFQWVSRIGFITAATSLTGSQPNFCTSPGLLHYIHFRGILPLTEFCPVQNSLYVQVLHSPVLATLLHGTPAEGITKLCSVVQGMELRNFRRGRHLYSVGRLSRWASAHIVVHQCSSSRYCNASPEPLQAV